MPLIRLSCLLSLLIASSASAVTIDWVAVGNPGNAPDTEVMNDGSTGYGAVPYVYQISKYEVTNAQYAEFLNAVADTDANALYNTNMAIDRFGSAGGYTYTAFSSLATSPVNYVSAYDALRFANWLQNGQLNTGSQTSATTETGAYTFSDATTVGARNAGATIFLPSENEWYKAAYYSPGGVYYDYPAGSSTPTTCATPSATPNTANCANIMGDVTPVGDYTDATSPYGTFDQGGNVNEWTETTQGSLRVERGGGFVGGSGFLAAGFRGTDPPDVEHREIGFRIAMIPEPGTGLLVIAGLLGLGMRRRISA